MTRRPAFTLLESVLAAVLLAMIVAASVPMLRPRPALPSIRCDPALQRAVRTNQSFTPLNATMTRVDSLVEGEIQGEWVIVCHKNDFAISWQHRGTPERRPEP